MITVPPTPAMASDDLAAMLRDARQHSLKLMQDILPTRERGPLLGIVNPPLWELGHVGFFHDYFALRGLYELAAYQIDRAEQVFDSSSIAHDDRWTLPLPSHEETLAYLARVEEAMLKRLPDGGMVTSAQSYVYQLTLLHEDMHGEAFIYTRQTLGDPPPSLGTIKTASPTPTGALSGDVQIPGGSHLLGSDSAVPFRFDNEKPPMTVEVAPYSIARATVTNAEFAAFVDDGGYEQPGFWSQAGWQWRQRQQARAPVYWRRASDDKGWEERVFDRWEPLAPHQPVVHVNLFEAEAWCRWAGRRLPTEAEWDMAASRAPSNHGRSLTPHKRRYPWGDAPPTPELANLDASRMGRVDVGAMPEGDSAFGCRQMLGNVWEWTATTFGPFPGFQADLYRDYSEPWFAERRRVLRGGAWATRSRLVHNGYRNFFTPERQDILTGFRSCAR